MGWAAALHPALEQRGLLDLRVVEVGVEVPEPAIVVGVAVPDEGCMGVDDCVEGCWTSEFDSETGRLAVMSLVRSRVDSGSVGVVPPRRGERSCSVDEACMLSSPTVLERSSWWPAKTKRTSGGTMAAALRKARTFSIVCSGRTFSGIARYES